MAGVFEAREVRKRYGATEALRGVSVTVGQGEVFGLLGPNGAGKSTLAKIAAGLVRPTSGEASVGGHRAGSIGARGRVGYLAELFRFPGWASAEEILRLHQRLAGSGGAAGERRELLDLVGLGDATRTRVAAMSKGMQQRLGIAQALIGQPHLLLLDEPTSALDPAGRRVVRELLATVRSRGISVVLSSHLLGEVELVCDRVAIIVAGQVVEQGTPGELTRPRGVELETDAGVRLIEAATRDDVPRIVAERVGAGERIYGVRVLASTLEDAYLEAVGEEQG